MQIPKIKHSGGIFEIFVPGIFLFFNILLAGYLFFEKCLIVEIIGDLDTKLGISLFLIAIICLGYLFGMILRLFRSELLDKYSSIYFKVFKRWSPRLSFLGSKGIIDITKSLDLNCDMDNLKDVLINNDLKKIINLEKDLKAKKIFAEDDLEKLIEILKVKSSLWATEDFPYLEWLGLNSKYNLPQEVNDFYEQYWMKQLQNKENKRFFNLLKRLVYGTDVTLIDEIITSETTIRYLSGISYALFTSIFSLIASVLFRYVRNTWDDALIIVLLIILIYIIALFSIIKNYKYLRIKEVESLFDASFKHSERIAKYFTSDGRTHAL